MGTLRRLCRSNGFLVVYICTHIATLWKSPSSSTSKVSKNNVLGKKQKIDGRKSAQFLMNDSVWRDPATLESASISLNELVEMLDSIYCKRKVVLLHYGHQHYTKPSVFGFKMLYPPPNFLTLLSKAANCAVVGSCHIGSKLKDLMTCPPVLLQMLRTKYRKQYFKGVADSN